MPSFDPSRLTPDYLASLSEQEQQDLLEELKGELAKVQANVRAQQRDSVKRLQRSIARHEAQLAFLSGEIKKIDEILAGVDPATADSARKQAAQTLTLGRTFYRSGRKMLAIQMQELRGDLAAIATEVTQPFEVSDPFSTYEYRRASAEADLAALQLLMIQHGHAHRLLALALETSTEPAAGEEPSGGGTAMLAAPASRKIKVEPGREPATRARSAIGLEDNLPPPGDLPAVTVAAPEEPDPAQAGEPAAEDMAIDPGAPAGSGQDESAPAENAQAEGAPAENAPAENAPAGGLSAGEAYDVDHLKKMFTAGKDLEKRAVLLADHLREANGLIAKGLEYMGHIATSPPAEGAKLLDQHIWNKVNGKEYFLRRLPDQVADSAILATLFPRREAPVLPFERPMSDSATRPIASVPTDRLGLHD